MRAVVIARFGEPDVLEVREVPTPEPGPEEVRVRVRATALNRADILQRRGRYPAPPGAPADIPGLEFAGEVEACGRRATLFAPGDRVMGILGGGGYAEQVVTHERLCLPVPSGMELTTAAAVPEAFLTAFDALLLQAGLQAGEALLVPAAASGVGTGALQIARAAGARTVGLARTADKRTRLEDLGLGPVLDPAAPELAARIRELTGGTSGGIDVVLDLVGSALWGLHLEVLRERGRMVLTGTLSGARVEADLSLLMRKRLSVTGTVLRSRPLEEKIAVTQAFVRRLLPLVAAGALAPVIDRVLALADAAQAHALMERNATFGKIVLSVD